MMNGNTFETPGLKSMLAADGLSLVNVIDQLRSQGASHYVSLPQLIVCGDQSSGKSSVLEAISGIPFPTKDNLCTRFATELILRRTSEVHIGVSIVPSHDRTKEQCEQLGKFKELLQAFDDLPKLIDKAKEAMGITTATSAFSNDVLRVEISGPGRPHLTIVDLPGLIHSENKLQTASDVELVQGMIRSYMAHKRTVILAVVSAKNDYANQIVLKLAKEADPKGLRTLGIITKPDTLPEGSDSEDAFISLAKNEDVEFRLGWHVLKNRNYEMRHCSLVERDEAEEQFFNTGAWRRLPRRLVGIAALRPRLSKVLLNQISAELPELVGEIEQSIAECRKELERLGDRRGTCEEQRHFLLNVSQAFQSLVKAAISGAYEDSFFGDPRTEDGFVKRFRAVTQKLNLAFAEHMRLYGSHRKIVLANADDSCVDHNGGTQDNNSDRREQVTRADLICEIKELLERTRGRELPGMYNPMIIRDIFLDQSRPWKKIVHQHLSAVHKSAGVFLSQAIFHLTDEDVSRNLIREIINPFLENIHFNLTAKGNELLELSREIHPITYNHYFTETIQNIREQNLETEVTRKLQNFFNAKDVSTLEDLHVKKLKVSSLVEALARRNEADMDKYACSEILDCTEAFYKVAMKLLVDNITIQCVEAVLVSRLDQALCPSQVMQMDTDLVEKIASESAESRNNREALSRKLATLESCLSISKQSIAHRGEPRGYSSRLSDNYLIHCLSNQSKNANEIECPLTMRRQWQAIEVYIMTNVQQWRVEIAAAKIPAELVYAGPLREIQAGQ
ncbi:hypothetical protein BDV24DRAFT_169817 [Aspergillus arachidicola]|uniref:Uncharacterized protein n=1 Tax=Aspergillus arachidicola TaxID=656916 RepID=A0A5N6XQ32_9EURO|nr:hypothetical protein BDV24DRAFT_169817 [Aspergillus arachidicola]